MTGYHEQCLFFAPTPDLKTLYSVFLSFDSFSSQSDEGELRNTQVKTCRELLHLYADLIASPVLGSYGGIRVIMAITFFKRGIIQVYAQSHSLQTSSPERVLHSTLQMCLSYSLTARLAPNWNRAGQYLIAGKDFLSDASKRIAVVMELSVGETELCVSVEATTVRLPPVTLKDFDVPALIMERFLNNKETVLQTKTPNNWCYILPSMKKGQVISIRRTLPPECPFQTYTELQSHWNNMYGYYLPPLNEDEVVYCSVYFKPLGEKLFTYPLCCIRIQPVQCFPRVNLQGALRAFVSDVRSLMENVCGFTAQMTSKPYYHTTSLSRPSLQDSQDLPANLTSRSSSRLVLTQLPNVSPPERVPLSQLAFSPWPISQPVSLKHNVRHSATSSVHGTPQIPNPILQSSHCHGTEACKVPSSFSSRQSFSSSLSLSTSPPLPSSSQRAIQRPKLVPVFTNKSLSRHVNITKILAEKRQQKQVEAHRVLESAVKKNSCSPLSSVPSLPRVSLPYFKKCKRDCGVYATTPAQSGFQTQPAPLTEIKTGGEVFESHPKKAKVKVQEVDVVKCARSNQLAKINVATLQAWLKGRGIAIRSKDKKDDLMSKVMQFLSEP